MRTRYPAINLFVSETSEILDEAEGIIRDVPAEIRRLCRIHGLRPRFLQSRVKNPGSLNRKMATRQPNAAIREIRELIAITEEIARQQSQRPEAEAVLQALRRAIDPGTGSLRWDTVSRMLDRLGSQQDEEGLGVLVQEILNAAKQRASDREYTNTDRWQPRQWEILLWTAKKWLDERQTRTIPYDNLQRWLLWKWDIHDVPGIRLVLGSPWECFTMAQVFFASDPCVQSLTTDKPRYTVNEWILVEEDLKEPDFKPLDNVDMTPKPPIEFTGYYARHLVLLVDPQYRRTEFGELRKYLKTRLQEESSIEPLRNVQRSLQEDWNAFQNWLRGNIASPPSGLGSGMVQEREHQRNRLHSCTLRRLLLEYPEKGGASSDKIIRSRYLYSLMLCEVQIRTLLHTVTTEQYLDDIYRSLNELRENAGDYDRIRLERIINLVRSLGDMIDIANMNLQDLLFRYEEIQRSFSVASPDRWATSYPPYEPWE